MTEAQTTEVLQTPPELEMSYKFIDILGEGANGKTYLAKHLNSEVLVAVKALKFSQNDDMKSFELFQREATILKSIQINGVPRFYESIFPENSLDTCYIIQEYVEFPSLQTIINELGRMPEQDTLDIIEKVASILFKLQTQYTPPIIHRDIKPSNILCCKLPSGLVQVYLIDFGAVANPQKRSGGSTVAGTFGYMAPEQLIGDIALQSDYYSLGATALHCLTGMNPYEISSDVFKLNFEEILQEKAPQTSPAARALLSLLLAPEADKRPQNAQALLQAIHSAQKGIIPKLEDKDQVRGPVLEEKPPSKVKAFFIRLFKATEINYSLWSYCPGVIRNKTILYDVNFFAQSAVEYTFVYNDTTWVGVSAISNFDPENRISNQLQFPIPCEVRFNLDDPRMNCLHGFKYNGLNVKNL